MISYVINGYFSDNSRDELKYEKIRFQYTTKNSTNLKDAINEFRNKYPNSTKYIINESEIYAILT